MTEETTTKIQPLSYYVFAGLQQMIAQDFAVKPPIFSTAENVQELLRTGVKPEYPFCYLRLVTMGVSTKSDDGKSRNPHEMARLGMMNRFNTDRSEAQITAAIPTTYAIELHFITDNFNQVMTFNTRWTFAHIRNRLDFKLGYMDFDYDIGIELDPSLTVPTQEGDLSSPGPFEFVDNLSVRGYLINDDPRDIRDVPLVKHLNLRLQTT